MELALIAVGVALVGLIAYRVMTPKAAMRAGKTVDHRVIMMVVVTIAVLGSSLYIILSGTHDEGTQKWAFGAVGSIIGFWLKPA